MARNYIKPVLSPEEAIKSVKEGMSVMIGGFNYGGVPYTLVEALEKAGTKGLTMISNDTSYATVGHGRLVAAGQIKKVIASHIGINKKTGEQYNAGTLELELVPQGTFVERIRCGGFGMGGFLTPTGLGTKVEEGKQVIEVDGKKYLLEKPLRADVALIRALCVRLGIDVVRRQNGQVLLRFDMRYAPSFPDLAAALDGSQIRFSAARTPGLILPMSERQSDEDALKFLAAQLNAAVAALDEIARQKAETAPSGSQA